MKYATALVLYLIFSCTSAIAGAIGLIAAPFNIRYTANVMHAMDCLLAALLGWDGRSTVSKECGRRECRLCRLLCALLHRVLEEKHCEKEGARR